MGVVGNLGNLSRHGHPTNQAWIEPRVDAGGTARPEPSAEQPELEARWLRRGGELLLEHGDPLALGRDDRSLCVSGLVIGHQSRFEAGYHRALCRDRRALQGHDHRIGRQRIDRDLGLLREDEPQPVSGRAQLRRAPRLLSRHGLHRTEQRSATRRAEPQWIAEDDHSAGAVLGAPVGLQARLDGRAPKQVAHAERYPSTAP